MSDAPQTRFVERGTLKERVIYSIVKRCMYKYYESIDPGLHTFFINSAKKGIIRLTADRQRDQQQSQDA